MASAISVWASCSVAWPALARVTAAEEAPDAGPDGPGLSLAGVLAASAS